MKYCRCGLMVKDTCPRCDESTSNRGYGGDWQRTRAKVLHKQPLCVDCEKRGVLRPAVEVHHKRTIKQAPALRLAPSNLVPLCVKCHAARHGRAGRGGRLVRG